MTAGKGESSQLVDGSVETVDPLPARIHLARAQDIRRELAAVYRDMRYGRIDTQHGTRLAYVLDLIRKSYETEVTEERLLTIHRVLKIRSHPNEG